MYSQHEILIEVFSAWTDAKVHKTGAEVRSLLVQISGT